MHKVSKWIEQHNHGEAADEVMRRGVLRQHKCMLRYHVSDNSFRPGQDRREVRLNGSEMNGSRLNLASGEVKCLPNTSSSNFGSMRAEEILCGWTSICTWHGLLAIVMFVFCICAALVVCLSKSPGTKFSLFSMVKSSENRRSGEILPRKKTKKKQSRQKDKTRPVSEQQTTKNESGNWQCQSRQQVRRRRQDVEERQELNLLNGGEEENDLNQSQFMPVTRNGRRRPEGENGFSLGPCGLYNGVRGHENLCFMNSAIQLLFFAIKDFDKDLQMCSCAVANALTNFRVACRERASLGKSIDKQASSSFRDCMHRWIPLILPSKERQSQCDAHEFLEAILQIIREDLRSQISKDEHGRMANFCEEYFHRLEVVCSRPDPTEFASMIKILGEVKWDFDVLGMCVTSSRTRSSRLSSSPPSFVGQILTHTWDLNKQTIKGCEFEPFNVLVASLEASGESVVQLLRRYFHEDVPEGTTDIKRTTRMWRLPRSLIVSLRRFRFDKGISSCASKLETAVKISPLLRFHLSDENRSSAEDFQIDECDDELLNHREDTKCHIFELTGICYHLGGSLEAGHYVCAVKSSGDSWWECNDNVCTPVGLVDVMSGTIPAVAAFENVPGCSQTAYLLVYHQLER